MLQVYACIVEDHDLGLVIVAGLICLLAAFTTFSILQQARPGNRQRPAWLAAAGFVSGTGIWSTHFVAMLAFQPNLPIGYDFALTAFSVTAAIVVTGLGWWVAASDRRGASVLAGTIVGTGIGIMHYIGMSAVTLSGSFAYDHILVLASLLIGIGVTILAVADHRRSPDRLPWRPALLFALAISGLHFTAMAAARIYPDASAVVSPSSISSQTLSVAVVAMAMIILTISFAMVLFDRKLIRRETEAEERLRRFAHAAVEGLLVIDGNRIVDANQSLLRLAGHEGAPLPADALPALLPGFPIDGFSSGPDASISEWQLVRRDDSTVDVEILVRVVDWRGRSVRMLAIRDISERKEAAARIAHLAFHDALTGLPNRAVFSEHLERALAARGNDQSVAVLCIDLDGFKTINDLFGHPTGDELLIQVAQRLRNVAGADELVARLGGDEFGIVQLGGEQPHHAGLLAERLIDAVAAEFQLAGQASRVSCSIGVALCPADADSPAGLVKNADMALYRAKAEGRGIARFYENAMDEALRERRQLDAELRQAIEKQQLEIHYQPLADIEGGRIAGFEALLRWNHPALGEIGPDTFIPLAEESGFIVQLGAWVLRTACVEAATWQPSLKLSVNLSPVQFMHGDIAAEVETILEESGLPAGRLELEITEGLLIRDADRALGFLRRLKSLGVQISMDDFGTGYSSLSYFRMFPFDKVKIDESFVRDMIDNPQALAIVRSVIGLGQGLGMPVVAEGVETSAQLAALQAEGCDLVQGYLISRPGPIENFARVVIDKDIQDEQPDSRVAG